MTDDSKLSIFSVCVTQSGCRLCVFRLRRVACGVASCRNEDRFEFGERFKNSTLRTLVLKHRSRVFPTIVFHEAVYNGMFSSLNLSVRCAARALK